MGSLNQPQDGMQRRIRVRSYDTSVYKCAADQLLLATGVQLLFHAWAAARFPDCIGLNVWPMEIHGDGRIDWAFPRGGPGNLLVVGRCASMTPGGAVGRAGQWGVLCDGAGGGDGGGGRIECGRICTGRRG